MEVLQLDVSGRPQSWISAKEAAILYASDGVAWTLGDAFFVLRGGMQRRTGLQSRIEVHPIIAVRGAIPSRAWRQTPALSNPKLFNRDRMVCAYCGGHFHADDLTRITRRQERRRDPHSTRVRRRDHRTGRARKHVELHADSMAALGDGAARHPTHCAHARHRPTVEDGSLQPRAPARRPLRHFGWRGGRRSGAAETTRGGCRSMRPS